MKVLCIQHIDAIYEQATTKKKSFKQEQQQKQRRRRRRRTLFSFNIHNNVACKIAVYQMHANSHLK